MKPTRQELQAHRVAGRIVRLLSAYIPDVAMGRAIVEFAQHLEAHPDILTSEDDEFDEASPGGICHMGHDWKDLETAAGYRCERCGVVTFTTIRTDGTSPLEIVSSVPRKP